MDRALQWLRQAESDFAWLTDTLEGGHYAQACFVAQKMAALVLKKAQSELESPQ